MESDFVKKEELKRNRKFARFFSAMLSRLKLICQKNRVRQSELKLSNQKLLCRAVMGILDAKSGAVKSHLTHIGNFGTRHQYPYKLHK